MKKAIPITQSTEPHNKRKTKITNLTMINAIIILLSIILKRIQNVRWFSMQLAIPFEQPMKFDEMAKANKISRRNNKSDLIVQYAL